MKRFLALLTVLVFSASVAAAAVVTPAPKADNTVSQKTKTVAKKAAKKVKKTSKKTKKAVKKEVAMPKNLGVDNDVKK